MELAISIIAAWTLCGWLAYRWALALLRRGFSDAFNAHYASEDRRAARFIALWGPVSVLALAFVWLLERPDKADEWRQR